jgi:hypothetical protein
LVGALVRVRALVWALVLGALVGALVGALIGVLLVGALGVTYTDSSGRLFSVASPAVRHLLGHQMNSLRFPSFVIHLKLQLTCIDDDD